MPLPARRSSPRRPPPGGTAFRPGGVYPPGQVGTLGPPPPLLARPPGPPGFSLSGTFPGLVGGDPRWDLLSGSAPLGTDPAFLPPDPRPPLSLLNMLGGGGY